MQTLLQAYRKMLLIRRFEETVEKLFSEGRIVGTAHTCIGQEAIAVGVADALRPHDALTSTHRGHGHFLARGADPRRLLAELFGRQGGYSRGRGGSQMMMAPEIGFYGTNGITGASVAFAAGLALNAKLTGKDRVVAAFFGDGASNQGIIHETLNLSALWKLPLVAICETNGYAMSTPTETGVSTGSVAKRAEGYGIPGISIDGNDFELVRDTVSSLASRARGGEGPSLLECRTYRLSGHSRGDQRVYRSREEEREAWTREPIARLAAKIEESFEKPGGTGSLPVQNGQLARSPILEEIARSVEAEIAEAIAFAEADAIRADDILEGVYA
jgi:TPP-dependent pyruvate/acetoin dehydrogenase alpha subunit